MRPDFWIKFCENMKLPREVGTLVINIPVVWELLTPNLSLGWHIAADHLIEMFKDYPEKSNVTNICKYFLKFQMQSCGRFPHIWRQVLEQMSSSFNILNSQWIRNSCWLLDRPRNGWEKLPSVFCMTKHVNQTVQTVKFCFIPALPLITQSFASPVVLTSLCCSR